MSSFTRSYSGRVGGLLVDRFESVDWMMTMFTEKTGFAEIEVRTINASHEVMLRQILRLSVKAS